MATTAEMTLRASLLREESRGIHSREDFPVRDDTNWQKWLYLKNEHGEIKFWVEEDKEKSFWGNRYIGQSTG